VSALETQGPVDATAPPAWTSLADALCAVAQHHGHPIEKRALLAGLPVTDDILRPPLIARAAERAQLKTSLVQRGLDDIPDLVLPVVLLLGDEQAAVLYGRDGNGGLSVLMPGAEGRETVSGTILAARYAGYAVLLAPEPTLVSEAAGRPSAPHWFWATLAAFRSNYLHIALAAFLINILALAFPLFVMNVYDRVLPNGAIPSLIALSIGVLISFAFDLVLRLVRSRMIDLTGKQVDVTLSARLFQQLLGLKMAYRPPSAGVMANQIREFESVREFFTSGTVIAASDLLFCGVFLAVMAAIAGPLAIVPAVMLPLVLVAGFLIQRPLDRVVRESQTESAVRHGLLVETLGGIETVRALGAEHRMQSRWERSVAASARASESVHRLSALVLSLTSSAQNLASLAVIVWGVLLVLDNQITIGALFAANMLVGRILSPIANLSSVLLRGVRTFQSLKAIDRMMQMPAERPPGRRFVGRRIAAGDLVFQNVSFRYPGAENDALSDVGFSIAAGERIGIIGRIGSGKTTIGRLAAGFYEPDRGHVLVDGVDIRQLDPVDLREGVGFVLQESDLFRGTIRDNITAGRTDASDTAMIEAAALAGVDEIVRSLPLGYDTPVAEGGQSLSGGQKQSIALARALIRKPRLLFLDEPTSALDMHSESRFRERLASLPAETTLVISTHRTSLLQLVDRLLVFDNGRLVADGPKVEVLAALQQRATKAGTP
jgi:ATP-binding cassette subfamily C protein LapB